MSFRDKVMAEAFLQKQLRAKGEKISEQHKKYARLSGLMLFLVSGSGCAVILLISSWSNLYSIFGILFTATFCLGGLAQLITGRHLLTKR